MWGMAIGSTGARGIGTRGFAAGGIGARGTAVRGLRADGIRQCIEQARLGQQHLGGYVQRPGEQLEHPDGGLVHAALKLAEIGIGQAAELGQLAEREVRELSLAADEGPECLHLGIPLIRHLFLLAS